jgi:hypothetical protein
MRSLVDKLKVHFDYRDAQDACAMSAAVDESHEPAAVNGLTYLARAEWKSS